MPRDSRGDVSAQRVPDGGCAASGISPDSSGMAPSEYRPADDGRVSGTPG